MTDDSKKTVCFQIDKKHYQLLKQYAKNEKQATVSWLLRNLVSDFTKQLKK